LIYYGADLATRRFGHEHLMRDGLPVVSELYQERTFMNLRSLPILAAFVLSPIALAAQAPAFSPVHYAASAAPASFSSSLAPHALFAAPTAGAPSSAVAVPSQGSSLPLSGLAVGLKIGFAGYGFDVATPLWPKHLNIRGGASFLVYTPGTIVVDNLNINGTIKFQNASTMLDWFPFHGRFRLSAGATVYNNTGLSATLYVPYGQSFTVGSTTYYSEPYNAVINPNGPIQGSAVFTFGSNKAVPRTTVGFGNMLSKNGRVHWETEIGVEYISPPTVSYMFTGTGCTTYVAPSTYAGCGPIPQANVQSEQAKIQNDLYDLRFYPIISLGLSYRLH
jgi:hypothetical protein